ncbi:uncharacterized protein DNG_09317 [Cephalotrichum gorgonifer]|uniref:C2H2-type domain-containing protein n=1 Tax=Cephalotrichum gorgonifer TaxID=2041049 RepID=A0AAE8N867_9PEZI|nr:uncharacterized protein DNG_09317 [Cephalotrichum gorgonifer]
MQHHGQGQYYPHRDPQPPMDPNSFMAYDRRVSPYGQQHPSPIATEDFSSTPASSRLSSAHQQPIPNTTPDSMDQQGYPHHSHNIGAASSSMSIPHTRAPESIGSMSSIGSMGSMGSFSDGAHAENHVPVKYTPVTGRVSKALKGVSVHTCHDCVPHRTFSRNEHLRRHQLSHKTPAFACKFVGCTRRFHRKDLLDRHEQKHGPEKEKAAPRRGGSQNAARGRRMPDSAPLGLSARSRAPSRLGATSFATPTTPRRSSTAFSGSSFVSGIPSHTPPTPHGFDTSQAPSTPLGFNTSQGPSTPHGYGQARQTGSFDSNGAFSPGITTSYSQSMPTTLCPTINTTLSPSINTTLSPTLITPDGYHQPTSQGQQGFGNTYVFSSPSSHPMPILHQPQSQQDNTIAHHNLFPNSRSQQRPNLHIQFLPPADNPPDLLHHHDPAGIPSSASSTSYSPVSEPSRQRSKFRSPSADWVDNGGFLAPSPFPAEMMGGVSLDSGMPPISSSPVAPSPTSPVGLGYSSYSPQIVGARNMASMFVTDMGMYPDDHSILDVRQQQQSPKRRYASTP